VAVVAVLSEKDVEGILAALEPVVRAVVVTVNSSPRCLPPEDVVPITGVGLLMQRLMTASSLDQVPWLYFIPVLAPIGLYSWLALRWARPCMGFATHPV
jgi:hypothetical protein